MFLVLVDNFYSIEVTWFCVKKSLVDIPRNGIQI